MYKTFIVLFTGVVMCFGALSSALAENRLQVSIVPQLALRDQTDSIHGLRVGLWNRNHHMRGLDIGVVNETGLSQSGLEIGAINKAENHAAGIMVGVVNRSRHMHGVQIGFANFTDSIDGLQIGFWNQINRKHNLRVFPFFNATF